MVIKRIGPVSCAKISAIIYAVMGLLIGAVISLAALIGGLASETTEAVGIGAVMGVGAILVLPILYGGIGFVATLVAAVLYNLAAGAVGGIELDVQ